MSPMPVRSRAAYHKTATVAVLLMMVLAGLSCAPRTVQVEPKPPAVTPEPCLPGNLSLLATLDRSARIAWDLDCPGIRIMQGFNIYVSRTPLVERYPGRDLPDSIRPYNPLVYPGDTAGNPDHESYEIKGIENAVRYFVHVRVIHSDGGVSLPTNEITVVCLPRGEIVLRESYSGERDGFSFARNASCRTDDLDNDLYYYHKDGHDYLCSPVRIGPVYRATQLAAAGHADSLDPAFPIVPGDTSGDKVEVVPGGVYIIVTQDGYPARLRLKQIRDEGGRREAVLDFIYQPPIRESE
jgi:hypothetical protein